MQVYNTMCDDFGIIYLLKDDRSFIFLQEDNLSQFNIFYDFFEWIKKSYIYYSILFQILLNTYGSFK